MRVLGKTNLEVNEIGLGGIPIQRVTKEIVNEIINKMIEQSMNFIDTARGYTVSEELLGAALEGKRQHFILATKSMARDYDSMRLDIETSLNNLRTNYIDLYQLHNVSDIGEIEGALLALKVAKKEGKIGFIGITSHKLEIIEKAVDMGEFDTIQFPYNVVENQGEKVFEKAKQKNIGVIVMKPLGGGAIIETEVALKFILKNDNISVVIPGMDSVEQVIENNSVLCKDINSEDICAIEKIKKELSYDFCRRCGYCLPCSVGINIPFVFLCEGYYTRYNLKEWAISRYNALQKKASDCIACGGCEKKCPYELNIVEKMKKVAKIMENKNE